MADQLTELPAAPSDGSRLHSRSVAGVTLWALALSFGVFLLYFLAYPVRHLSLPAGFDPAYYIWHGQYLASEGLGTGSLAARPGYPILSAVAGSLTGMTQLQVTPVLSMTLVPILALAVGAFASGAQGARGARWALVVAATGVVVGPTHLVGENLSNTLNLALMLVAIVMVASAIAGGAGSWGAIVLLVASGVAHWDFLLTLVVVLAMSTALAVATSRREGDPRALRREIRLLALTVGAVGGIMAVLIGAILRAPLITIEAGQDRVLYWKKFKRDLSRLVFPAVAAVAGGWALGAGWMAPETEPRPRDRRRWRPPAGFPARFLFAWTAVMAAGALFGAITLTLPPARFLALLVAFPGAVAVGWLLASAASRLGRRLGSWRRSPRVAALAAVSVVLLSLLALPGVLRWYRYPVLLDGRTLQEARTAGRYVSTLPKGEPVLFVVDYYLPPFPTGPILAERAIRIGMSPDRAPDVHVFVGDVDDVLRGRESPPPNDRLDESTRTYRRDVAPLLSGTPVILVLRGVAGSSFDRAGELGAEQAGAGILVLNAPVHPVPLASANPPRAVTSLVPGALWGLALLMLLGVCGIGWSKAMLGGGVSTEALVSVAPVAGAGALILGGLMASLAGVRLAGAGGVFVYVAVMLTGLVAARVAKRPRP